MEALATISFLLPAKNLLVKHVAEFQDLHTLYVQSYLNMCFSLCAYLHMCLPYCLDSVYKFLGFVFILVLILFSLSLHGL